MSALSLARVSVGEILRDVSLDVARGERIAILGPSGAGKSTCLRLFNGLVRATSGVVRVLGQELDAHDLVSLRRRIGYVIQGVGLLPHLDVASNVGIVPRLLGWNAARIAARVDEVLALVGLEPSRFRARMPARLSGGERQRVGVARAIAAEPAIVLMDEPFGALDPLTRADLQRDVGGLLRSLGATSVLVTHDVVEALSLGDRIVLFEAGRVVVDAPRERFFASDHPLARRYADAARAQARALSEVP